MAQSTTSTYNLFKVEQSFSWTNIYINILQSDKNRFISRNHKPVSKVSTYHNKRLGNSNFIAVKQSHSNVSCCMLKLVAHRSFYSCIFSGTSGQNLSV